MLNLIHFRFLLPLLLQYDSTAEESDTTESHGVGSSVQIAKNMHAFRASQALSRLSGLCSDGSSTPFNQAAADSLRALLTPKLASMLKDQVPKDLLSRLNTNLESPEVNMHFSMLPFYLWMNFSCSYWIFEMELVTLYVFLMFYFSISICFYGLNTHYEHSRFSNRR